MAQSGDFVTPRLNGTPWLEKPPLTYWLTAVGHGVGLPDEWAARLPQALLSVAFLAFFYVVLAREFSAQLGLIATAILATSVGWLAYSYAALTDLPMSAALFSAILITQFSTSSRRNSLSAGALLGVAILAKGLVPVVLFAPVWLFARGKRLSLIAGALIVAGPWYVLCWAQNGRLFWDEFFWKQHIARFFTPALEHVQPIWFYVPVVIAGLFPWSPLFGLLFTRRMYNDSRIRLLGGWVIFGLLFFSASTNKLPGYVLPLLPGLAILMATAALALMQERPKRLAPWLSACALLLGLIPTVAAILPIALRSGLSRTTFQFAPFGFAAVFLAALVYYLCSSNKADIAVYLIVIYIVCTLVYGKQNLLVVLDKSVSVRPFARANPAASEACVYQVPRALEYGLDYYFGHHLFNCVERPTGRMVKIQAKEMLLQDAQ